MERKKYEEIYNEFERVLLKLEFSLAKAKACAIIFANNSRDGVYSHGLNRFPVFVDYVKKGWVDKDAEPHLIKSNGFLEQWDGQLGPGMLNAQFCMQRAINIAKENGMSCVALRNTNHWMRGGTYGWQAADSGCIGINFTNTIAIMPPWGAKESAIGNNPLIIAVPRKEGNIVLDMAMSQFSYGKMQEYQLKEKDLPFYGGYDEDGNLTKDPAAIKETKRPLPAGMWKGSGLAIMLDILATVLSDGRSTATITRANKESGISQVFMCFDKDLYPQSNIMIDDIIQYTKSASPVSGEKISYPGENTLAIRKENLEKGIPVDDHMWEQLLKL